MVKRRYAGCQGFGSGCRRGILAVLLSLTVCLVAACGSADAPPGAGTLAGPASSDSRSDVSLVPPATASETAAETAADEPGVQQITLYYPGYRDESPQFDRLNALLKEKGHPWRIQAINYYPEVLAALPDTSMSCLCRSRALRTRKFGKSWSTRGCMAFAVSRGNCREGGFAALNIFFVSMG